MGDDGKPPSENAEFVNLAPPTDGDISNDKPDDNERSHPADLRPQVRKDLAEYIISSTDASRPCLPNFLDQVGGLDCSAKVLKRQACCPGSIDASTIHELRPYVDHATASDDNAYTIAWIYDSGAGARTSYATHPTASENLEWAVDFRMTQFNSQAATGNCEAFRRGARAFRNSRD